MFRSSWILGLGAVLLVACGVETTPVSSQQDPITSEAQVSGERELASDQVSLPDAVHPAVACTPGDFRDCCPFPEGCSCLGDQFCKDNGQWSVCAGAGRKGQPCP